MSAPHPFLVDQRPYLARASSSLSIASQPTAGPSTYNHSNTSSSTLDTTTSLASTISCGSAHHTASPTPSASSVSTSVGGVDRECLRFMREAEQLECTFGSCTRSGGLSEEERSLRRETQLAEERKIAEEAEAKGREEKKRRRLGHIF